MYPAAVRADGARACPIGVLHQTRGPGEADSSGSALPRAERPRASSGRGATVAAMTDAKPFPPELRASLVRHRVLVLDGPLDDDNGTALAAQLLSLAAENDAADIALWIHSPGGSVPAMLAIRDVMRLVPCDVSTLALGLACSAGQFLLSAGTPGKRFALPHAKILMHQGSSGIGGSAVEVEVQANDLRHTRDTVLGLIADDTGQAAGAGLRGLAARPLVHRRAGPRVRVRRRHRHRLRPGHARAAPARRDGGRVMGAYTIPNVVTRDSRGERIIDVYSHLLAERIVYLGTGGRLRRRQRADRPAAPPRGGRPRPGDLDVHQLRGRRHRGDARGLRHHAVRPRAGGDHVRRAGGRGRRGAPRGRGARAGARRSRTPGWCCTSPRRRGAARSPT